MKLLIAFLLLSTQLSFSQSVRSKKNVSGSMTLTGEGFSKYGSNKKFQVNFYINNNFDKQILAEFNGSFSYTIAKDKISNGDKVKVQVNQWNEDGSHWKKTFTVIKDETPDQQDEIDRIRRKIPRDARKESDKVARRISRDIALVISWKRSFARSYIDSYKRHSDYKSSAGETYYLRGRSKGRKNAADFAITDATQAAIANATKISNQKIKTAFTRSVNDPQRTSIKELTSEVPRSTFNQKRTPDSGVNIDERTRELNRQLQREKRQLEDNLRHLHNEIIGNLRTQDARKYLEFNIQFKAESALEAWKYNRYGGRYDKSFYNTLEKYPEQNFKSMYQRSFKESFRQQIERYVRDDIESNYRAKEVGRDFGRDLGSLVSFDLGYDIGFEVEYERTSIETYNYEFPKQYSRNFESERSYYENNAVIINKNLNIKLIEENSDGYWEIGEKVGASIDGLVNIGLKRFDGKISIKNSSIIEGNQTGYYKVEPLSNKISKSNFNSLGRISPNVQDDKNYTLNLNYGKGSKDLSLYYGWRNVIKDLRLEVYDKNRNGIWEKDEEILLDLKSARNSSFVDASFEVQVQTNVLENQKYIDPIELKAKSSINQTVNLGSLGTLRRDLNEDNSYNIKVKIGVFEYNFPVLLGWRNIVSVYPSNQSAELKEVILDTIKKEWNEITAKGQYKNWYKNKRNGKETHLEILSKSSRNNSAYESLRDQSICKMVSSHYWLSNPWNYNFAKSFKRLWKYIQPHCVALK